MSSVVSYNGMVPLLSENAYGAVTVFFCWDVLGKSNTYHINKYLYFVVAFIWGLHSQL